MDGEDARLKQMRRKGENVKEYKEIRDEKIRKKRGEGEVTTGEEREYEGKINEKT